jgi:hypothetical protein
MVLKKEASLSLFLNLKVVLFIPPSHHCLNCASHLFSQHSIFCVLASFGWMYSFHPRILLVMLFLHNMEEDQQTHTVLFLVLHPHFRLLHYCWYFLCDPSCVSYVSFLGGYGKRHTFRLSVATYLTTLLYYPYSHVYDVTIEKLVYFLVNSSRLYVLSCKFISHITLTLGLI